MYKSHFWHCQHVQTRVWMYFLARFSSLSDITGCWCLSVSLNISFQGTACNKTTKDVGPE